MSSNTPSAFIAGLSNTVVQTVWLVQPDFAEDAAGGSFFQGSYSPPIPNSPPLQPNPSLSNTSTQEVFQRSFPTPRYWTSNLPRPLRPRLSIPLILDSPFVLASTPF